jgi:nitrite reductase/ring-hydroxylating ferredoxin subunit
MKDDTAMNSDARWWPVALTEEVSKEKPLGVRCLSREIVLFRDADGVARALEDRCAHRRAPLSLGKIMPGGLLACPYHGWRYEGATGQCRVIPNFAPHETVPATYRVRRFATLERAGLVFIWSGAPEEAVESALPAPWLWEGFADAALSGNTLLTVGYDDFVAALLDNPDLLFKLNHVVVLPFHPHGDPVIRDRVLTIERAADNTDAFSARAGTLPDYPFRMRISVGLDTSIARLDLATEIGSPMLSVLIAFTPAAGSVMSVGWRATAPGFSVRKYIEPAGLLALVPQASLVWRASAPLQLHSRGTVQ